MSSKDGPGASPGPSSEAARKRLRQQATRDTAPEMALRRELHRRGLRYRVHVRLLQEVRRTSDIVFRRAGVAVDVRGCWWHGCDDHRPAPRANRDWWFQKRERNRSRDDDTLRRLEAEGWRVLVVWEHEEISSAADRVELAVRGCVIKRQAAENSANFGRALRGSRRYRDV
ncbi:DNA mismatch endonuclease Vsr [Micromonospora taraxaci]|uniref:very short patch repair endonuclease n=1 Tax=Micromonospora taraxaci TaxID=1316803 RepID=UPI003401DC4C